MGGVKLSLGSSGGMSVKDTSKQAGGKTVVRAHKKQAQVDTEPPCGTLHSDAECIGAMYPDGSRYCSWDKPNSVCKGSSILPGVGCSVS